MAMRSILLRLESVTKSGQLYGFTKIALNIRSGGLRRLQHRVATGRPSKLRPTQKRTLEQQLRKGALAAGFPTDRWTLERIAALIEQEFGVRYHPHYLSRLLRQLGFTPQPAQSAAVVG